MDMEIIAKSLRERYPYLVVDGPEDFSGSGQLDIFVYRPEDEESGDYLVGISHKDGRYTVYTQQDSHGQPKSTNRPLVDAINLIMSELP